MNCCETCAHCLRNGCVPVTEEKPLEWPVIDETLVPEPDLTRARAFWPIVGGDA